jgi:UDP-glucose 4-epimerase
MRGVVAGRPWRRFGSGDELRDMLHVDDAVDAILRVLAEPSPGTWNVGSGGITMNQLLEALETAVHRPVAVEKVPGLRMSDHVLDASRFTEKFGWSPRVDLTEGVQAEFRYHCEMGTL